MIIRRNAAARGTTRLGWLHSRHSFSFGQYHDPHNMGFRDLRVINDDEVAGGAGFGTHPHQNMEIISLPVTGALAHRDSTGGEETISVGEIQVMHAGTGITHSEFNPSEDSQTRFLQIWIMPDANGHEPGYHQGPTKHHEQPGDLHLAVAPWDDAEAAGALPIHANARVYTAKLTAGQSTELNLDDQRHAWIQVIDGAITANDLHAATGDGLAVSDESQVQITAERDTEVVVFDLA